ncbi:MAG: hypothetical protein ACFB0C_17330 [Leptolyngbyaceae cyanobacterium]
MMSLPRRFADLVEIAGILSITACLMVPSAGATDRNHQHLSLETLQQTEYRLEIPDRGPVAITPLSWEALTAATDANNWAVVYGQVVLLDKSADAEDDPALGVIYRDLNGDQLEDALVPLWAIPESDADFEGYTMALATVLNQAGEPVHVSTEWVGFLWEVTQVEEQIVAHVGGRSEDGSQEQVLTYDWTADGLEPVSQEPFSLAVPFPEGRDRYFVSDLDRWEGVRSTAAPLAALQDRFSAQVGTPIPGTDWTVISETEEQIVLGLTQTQLQDDSVSAIRYRFEYRADGSGWRLDWVGQQFSCVWGRGRQSWHNQLCS